MSVTMQSDSFPTSTHRFMELLTNRQCRARFQLPNRTMISRVGIHAMRHGWKRMWLDLTFLEKRLSITPMIGLHGRSCRVDTFRTAEEVWTDAPPRSKRSMPNVTMNYLDNRFEGEFYLGYYKVFERKRKRRRGSNNCGNQAVSIA